MISKLNDIKKGLEIVYQEAPQLVVEANFVRMQQCKPVMRTKLKNLITGKATEVNFHPGDKITEAELSRRQADYLYQDGGRHFFMIRDSFEQFSLPEETLGRQKDYLKEGSELDVLYFNGQPVAVSLPKTVNLKVKFAPEGNRGNTAQGRATKTVELETGATVQTPLFIKTEETVKINTETGEYLERAE